MTTDALAKSNFVALPSSFSRRKLLKTMSLTGAATTFCPSVFAKKIDRNFLLNNQDSFKSIQPFILEGPVFHLELTEQIINVSGKSLLATLVNGTLPGPTLHMKEGQIVTIHVTNRMSQMSGIHWHGLLLPYQMDGVPGMSFKGIEPGQTFTYQFPIQQNGTYWYHAHAGTQEQTGLIGTIIIDSAQASAPAYDQDYVVLLSDWTNDNPNHLIRKLVNDSGFDNYHLPDFKHFLNDIERKGIKAAINKRKMWNEMRMNPTDYSDLSGVTTFRYLINGYKTEDLWRINYKTGKKIKLRLINGAAQTIFDVRIPGLLLTVLATDGNAVQPIQVDELRIAPGETYELEITPTNAQAAWTFFAQSIDRTGYVAGTLASNSTAVAAIPALDKRQWLEMQDMMGDTSKTAPVSHATTEYGWQNEMRVDTPRINLDDPGINLRKNGRKVLTYAHLKSANIKAGKKPERTIELHITGSMERYVWGFDGLTHDASRPIHLKPDQRTRLILVNDTMMSHPIHLHGMWLDLNDEKGNFKVRKHTILVQPAQRVTADITPIEGWWPLHCHLFYHMISGMFREVIVSNLAGPFKNKAYPVVPLNGEHHHAS